jgi:hypothetical protein
MKKKPTNLEVLAALGKTTGFEAGTEATTAAGAIFDFDFSIGI